ncbi:MAG: hypothetical protein ALECFALPRED_009166 [Alectoria fallacina]|uniref:UBX domain-containing protein n=1 Tax=Alectoria fallacina TaxID=1903189 RepID=A0A8H3J6G0_9LECA|nr:MAG: hypothetical protein ALECFALPRED_009166 [Alectoria fallacina]
MFFDGDLQSGIALALSESKSVACFVKGDDVQSSIWEDDFLKDEQITTALIAKAITLRINGGSQEAQYLAAYYPVPVLPAFIMINNGQLVLDLRAGAEKPQFKSAILRALSSRSSQPQRTAHSPTPNTDRSITQHTSEQTVPRASTLATRSSSAHSSSDQPDASNSAASPGLAASPPPSLQSTTLNSDPDTLPSTSRNTADHASMPPSRHQNADLIPAVPLNAIQTMAPSSASPGGQPTQTVQNLLADRRSRLEKDKKEKDAAERAERKAKAEARKEAMVVAPDSAKAKQATYAAQQRERQQAAKLERERILRQIEHDKAQRKDKEERRKAIAKAEAEGTDGARGLVDQQLASEFNFPKSTRSKECAVQVRMFDGNTIRCRFPSDQTLRGNVRPWVDQQKTDDDVPYTFKQVLTPMPNRTLLISEEEESLQSLGLTPSATLVIVPVRDFTAAYSGGQDVFSKRVSAGYNVVSAGAGIVIGALGTFLGLGRATTPGDLPDAHDTTMQMNAEPNATGTGSGANFRTLRDQRDDQDGHQLYNGNQLNFEPRRDSGDKDE